jgi:hypothetical protein
MYFRFMAVLTGFGFGALVYRDSFDMLPWCERGREAQDIAEAQATVIDHLNPDTPETVEGCKAVAGP